MPKDQLFLLQPGFFKESEGPFYCGDSVAVEGLLSFFRSCAMRSMCTTSARRVRARTSSR